MRKQTKLVAVLSAAALLAIGASMTSFAATPHWDQEDGEWVYLDRNGDKVTDIWRKSNGQWYYLDEDGYMAKDAMVETGDNLYYVDENGTRVSNAWVSLDNDDLLDDDDISTVWYYFDGNGKAVGYDSNDEETIKRLNYGDGQSGYFIFNGDGIMLTGWQQLDNEDIYYLGEENEGWARTGWQFLDTDDEMFDDGDSEGEPYDDEEWFYFRSNGKARRNSTNQIANRWYTFDENGIMLDLWVYKDASGSNTNASGSSAVASASYYQEDNGGRERNWVWAYANTDYDDYDDDMYWFYLNNQGQPTKATAGDGAGADLTDGGYDDPEIYDGLTAKSIRNKTYIFDTQGRMRSGLFLLADVRRGSARLDGFYYFQEDDSHGSVEGQMVTNRRMTIEVDGEDETYYFKKNGQAYENTIVSGSLYGGDGALVNDFGDGSTYQVVQTTVPIYTTKAQSDNDVIPAGSLILVNGNGKIKKSGTVTDIDSQKVRVVNYIVESIEDDN